MDDCLFCKIARGKVPAKVVYEDDEVMAFEDIAPQAPVHVLIISKKHIPTALDIEGGDERLMGRMMTAANMVAREKGLEDRGFRLVLNCKSDALQTVFHIHIHLLGGRRMGWPPG